MKKYFLIPAMLAIFILVAFFSAEAEISVNKEQKTTCPAGHCISAEKCGSPDCTTSAQAKPGDINAPCEKCPHGKTCAPSKSESPEPAPNANSEGSIFDEIDVNDLREKSKPDQVFKGRACPGTELPAGSVVSVEDGVRIALARNIRLRQSEDDIERAAAGYRLARSYKNLQLTLSGVYTYQDPIEVIPMPTPDNETLYITKKYSAMGQAALQYLITTFGNIENRIAAAFVNINGTAEKYESDKRDLIFVVKDSFFSIFKARSMVLAAADYVDSSEDHLKISKSLYKNGMVSRYDVLRAQLSVSEAKQELVSAKKMLMLSRSAFLNILDYDDRVPFEILPGEMRFLPKDMSLSRLQDIGVKNRHEIKALDENLKASHLLLSAAKSENNPQVSISSNYSTQTITSMMPAHLWSVSLAMRVNIIDGGAKNAKIKDAEAVLSQVDLAMEGLKKQVKFEVEKSYLDLKEAEIRYNTAIQDEKTNEESYRMAKVRYENGLSTSLEMEDSLRSLNNSKQMRITQQNNYLVAMAGLERSMGRNFVEAELIPQEKTDK